MKFMHTPEMDRFIRAHYLLPAAELAEAFNAKFSTTRTSQQLHGARKARGLKTGRTGHFLKGMPANEWAFKKGKKPNATSFQKGQRPHNYLEIGTEILRPDDYLWIKIADPNIWKQKHILNWEAANGKVPDGSILWFVDQDQQNCDISNLEMITRSEQVHRNKMRINQYPDEMQETVKLIAKVRHKTSEKGRASV